MQPAFTASFWPRLVRTIVISSIATIAYLRMTTIQEPSDFRNVEFDSCDYFFSLRTRSRPASFSSRRNSRLKAQHGKPSKLRVSKRLQTADKGRKHTRTSNAAYDAHLVQQVLVDPSIHIVQITTFTTSFDFRSLLSTASESAPPLHHNPTEAPLRSDSSLQVIKNKPIFTLPQVRRPNPNGTRITDLPDEILHMIFEELFDPNEMSTHGRLAAFESASQVCSTWRSIILSRTFKVFYQLQKGRWRFDEFKYSPWEASFIYVPSWQLYHRGDCDCFGRGKTNTSSTTRGTLEKIALPEAEQSSGGIDT